MLAIKHKIAVVEGEVLHGLVNSCTYASVTKIFVVHHTKIVKFVGEVCPQPSTFELNIVLLTFSLSTELLHGSFYEEL